MSRVIRAIREELVILRGLRTTEEGVLCLFLCQSNLDIIVAVRRDNADIDVQQREYLEEHVAMLPLAWSWTPFSKAFNLRRHGGGASIGSLHVILGIGT